jgi:predicted kinase
VKNEGTNLEPHFNARRAGGFVRECHGDLHLGNIVLFDGVPQPFDCLEFNAELRFIDVISDVAFVMMDLLDHQSPGFAWQLLNGWLDRTGDFAGLAALHYYTVYRALVRAKVAAIRLTQPGLSDDGVVKTRSQLAGYLDLANRLSERGRCGLILMHGLSGSGKSSVGRQLACQIGAICLRSDVERKRPRPEEGATETRTRYSDAAISETYSQLLETTETLLHQGHAVIVDATFLKLAHRRKFEELAERSNVPWILIACDAPQSVLEERVQRRQLQGRDPSEATVDVLRSQKALIEPFTEQEQVQAIHCDTTAGVDGETLRQAVVFRLSGRGGA